MESEIMEFIIIIVCIIYVLWYIADTFKYWND